MLGEIITLNGHSGWIDLATFKQSPTDISPTIHLQYVIVEDTITIKEKDGNTIRPEVFQVIHDISRKYEMRILNDATIQNMIDEICHGLDDLASKGVISYL